MGKILAFLYGNFCVRVLHNIFVWEKCMVIFVRALHSNFCMGKTLTFLYGNFCMRIIHSNFLYGNFCMVFLYGIFVWEKP